ncbi:MAG: acyloxyacyl hydrolase [Cytophagaceae bacterium]
MLAKIFKVLVFILLPLFGYSQQENRLQYRDYRSEIGVRTGYSHLHQELPDNKYYRPLLILPYFNYYLTSNLRRSRLSLILEPQIVHVSVKTRKNPVFERELAVTYGLQYQIAFRYFLIYTAVTTGPNYITVNTPRQASGFIFSDNIMLGVKRKLIGSTFFDLQYRFRHISNAGLNYPNWGIDNHFVIFGLSAFL